jgi:hypothetical protein
MLSDKVVKNGEKYAIWTKLSETMSLIPLNGKKPFENKWQRFCDEKRNFEISGFKGHNAGVCCGAASDCLVLDVDDIRVFRTTCASRGWIVPDTFEVTTGGGGVHYYFQYPDHGKNYGNKSRNKLGFDIRGTGGQVVAAGSTHPDTGRIYTIAKNLPLAPPPPWLLSLYEKPKIKRAKKKSVSSIKLSPSAQPPTDKFLILCEIEPLFKASWEMKRTDLKDNSPSGYDLSLASITASVGWEDQEIADLLVAFAVKHGHDVKKRQRIDYIQNTIQTARNPVDSVSLKLKVMADLSVFKDVSSVFDRVEEYARLPLKELAQFKSAAKKKFGKDLNLNDFEACIRKERRTLKKREVLQDKSELPNIVVSDKPLRVLTSESIDALNEANNPPKIFIRDGNAVRIKEKEDGSPIVEMHNVNSIEAELSDSANYLAEGRKALKNVFPHKDICNSILTNRKLPFPPLKGIIEVPALGSDGTIIDTPGYDERSGLIYNPSQNLKIPKIKSKPTKADARKSMKYIKAELIDDFPFIDKASKANALGLLITPTVRELIDGLIPLFAVSAKSVSSGKSYFCSLNSVVTSGRPGTMLTLPKREEEIRKLLLSSLIAGVRLIVFDNVDQKVTSPALSSVLTSQVYADRILGRSEMVEASVSAIFMVNGNNIAIAGDLPRRTVWIGIDSQTSKPWQRNKFKHRELILWALNNRGEIVAALLTIARAWVLARQPLFNGVNMPSFNNWAGVVGGILEFCGIDGFLSNYAEMYDLCDEDDAQWEYFLREWYKIIGPEYKPISDIFELIKPEQDVRNIFNELIPEKLKVEMDGTFSSDAKRKLGKAFKAIEGRRFGSSEYRIVRSKEKDLHSGAHKWRVDRSA